MFRNGWNKEGCSIVMLAEEPVSAPDQAIVNGHVQTQILATIGGKRVFWAHPRSVKVKLYVIMYAADENISQMYRWIQQVFYLEPEDNIDIILGDTTKIGPQEP